MSFNLTLHNQRKLEALVDQHHEAVLRYVQRRTAPGNVDDALSDTFLVALRRIDDVPEDARLWLLGIARKVLASQEDNRPASEVVEGLDVPIGRAFERLSARDREALLLVVSEERTTDEAARVVSQRVSTFRWRFGHAKRRLARALEQVESEEGTAAPSAPPLNDAKETT
jgi:RNA polymerase sigma-70 factor (ECF subfamily)